MLGILPAGLTSVLVGLILLAPYRIGSPGTGVGRCPGQRSEPRQRKVKKKDACFSGSFISQVTRSLTQLLTNTLTSRQTSTDALMWLDWGQVCCWGCVKNSCASFRSVCVARWRRQSLFRAQKLFIIGVHCNDVRQSCVKLKNWHAAFPSSFFFYLSALQCLIMSWLSRSNKSPGCRVIIFLCLMAPLPHLPIITLERGGWLNTFVAPDILCECVWKAERPWLRATDLAMTCNTNMSRRRGDKGFFGKRPVSKNEYQQERTQHMRRFSGSPHPGTYSRWQRFKHGFAWLYLRNNAFVQSKKMWLG